MFKFRRSVVLVLSVMTAFMILTGCGTKAVDGTAGTGEETTQTEKILETKKTVSHEDIPEETYAGIFADETVEENGLAEGLRYNITESVMMGDHSELSYCLFKGEQCDLPYKLVVTPDGNDQVLSVKNILYDGCIVVVVLEKDKLDPSEVKDGEYRCCAVEFDKLPYDFSVIMEGGKKLECSYAHIDGEEIDKDYYALFVGTGSSVMYSTYVYKMEDGRYRYFNVTDENDWRNAGSDEVIRGLGIVSTKEEIIGIAEGSGSCGIVLFPDDDTIYGPDDFLEKND